MCCYMLLDEQPYWKVINQRKFPFQVPILYQQLFNLWWAFLPTVHLPDGILSVIIQGGFYIYYLYCCKFIGTIVLLFQKTLFLIVVQLFQFLHSLFYKDPWTLEGGIGLKISHVGLKSLVSYSLHINQSLY